MNWQDGLTGSALQIAGTNDTPLRVMAGPGTGKSFAMKRRVARLLEDGQSPSRILAITFTRNAASSLVKELHNLNIANCEKIKACTLHSFCFKTLRREDVFYHTNRRPRFITTFNKAGSLQFEGGVMLDDLGLLGQFGGKRDCTKRLRAFEAAWARLQANEPGWPEAPIDRQFHNELIRWLKFHQAMLVGELVPETLRFLRANPTSEILTEFDHVIVDEYQDLNRAEQEIIDLLATNGSNAIVGDADQSIYSFRYANPDGIKDFKIRHPNTHDEHLVECRRCPTSIVEIADSLIRNNHSPSRRSRLQTMQDNPAGNIYIVQWKTVVEEARGLAGFAKKLIDDREFMPGDILVLTPRRLLGYRIRDQLKSFDVPVYSFYHEEALEEKQAQYAFALLSLLVNKDDRVALRWLLGYGSSSNRNRAYQRLWKHCETSGDPPWKALSDLYHDHLQLPYITPLVRSFQEIRDKLLNLSNLDVTQLVDQLFPDNQSEYATLREIALLVRSNVDDAGGLLEHVQTRITQPEMPEEGEFVRIMSPHKSKGLTSKVTIIADCMQGLIPSLKKDQTPDEEKENLREQRRIFYVAITRCSETLVLSSVARMEKQLAYKIGMQVRSGGGAIGRAIASQFISELGSTAPRTQQGQAWEENGYQ